MQNSLVVREENFTDPMGVHTSVWAVYYKNRVVSVEFTRDAHGLTKTVELSEAK